MSLLCANGKVFADPWSTQPLLGLASVYASNPELVPSEGRSETRAALLVDLPVFYDHDALSLAVLPSVRYSGTQSFSSVTSDYYHLDVNAQYSTDLSKLVVDGTFHRDSSLLFAGGLSDGFGVRRDTTIIDANWTRNLTELVLFQIDGNTSRTLYSQSDIATSLVDNRYTSVSPSINYIASERDTLRVSGNAGHYYSLDGLSSSDSANAQLGFDHRLTESWTLTGSAGYSRSTNQYHYPFATFKSSENGTIYGLNATRQTEQLTLTAGVSRSLVPTGLAFLSRQDSVSFQANYVYSERWTFNAGVTWQNLEEPLITGGSLQRRFYDVDLSASWHWRAQWALTVHASRINQQYGQPSISVSSDGLSLEITRQSYRTNSQ